MQFLKTIFGTQNDRELKRIRQIVSRVNELEPQMKELSDDQFPQKTDEFKQRLENGEALDEILPEAFALVREAGLRVDNTRHFDVQILGGVVLHEGKIAEMKTGEGKTLTSTLPLYLNALTGKGCHVVTVNDYLAHRDSEWMGRIFSYLGMTTSCVTHGLSDEERRDAYAADITYGTNNEFGFDFLRDNMKTELDRMVQREHHFAIVDEVDSILIDEARTPLIISGPSETNTELYTKVNAAIPGLQKDSDYILDEKSRTVSLTEDGISKLEKRLRIENLYDPRNIDYLHHVQQALKAHVVFKKDVDYVVRDGKVIIVDEHTGRLMPGRRYSDGLHGALEAKEQVPIQNETQTLATITFQNYFRMYDKLAGMTGTADTEAVEFKKIYNLDVVVVPTNEPMVRDDQDDIIFRTAREKFNAIADEIAEAQKRGQPVLVGTVSVEKSELLSQLLKKRGIEHEMLNAKNHGREADIIADAGKPGRVTISTNMAGRGTDIRLGEGVKEQGGLFVIGTERHESRRIDNQLRGRSGRQGDPGRSRFYLSLEDDLMRIFASDKLSGIMSRLGMEEGESIVSPMVTRAVEKAQKRVEEQNFSSRKHLIEYDDVMNQQRQVIYDLRRQALEANDRLDFIRDAVHNIAAGVLAEISPEQTESHGWDFEEAKRRIRSQFSVDVDFSGLPEDEIVVDDVAERAADKVVEVYEKKMEQIGHENATRLECWVYLQVIDKAWKNHLLAMDALKDSVSLRGYGQRDPLQEYKKEAYRLFSEMMSSIQEETATALVQVELPEHADMEPALATDDGLDEQALSFQHPDAGNAYDGAAAGGSQSSAASQQGEADENLIYHGSRSEGASREDQSQPQPFRREGAKVGRNDPCPCGSGKKYKKCHGRPGAEQQASL